MRCLVFVLLMSSLTVWAQSSASSPSAPSPSRSPSSELPDAPSPQTLPSQPEQTPSASSSSNNTAPNNTSKPAPDLSAPRSDSVPASALEEGSSSSKDTQIDLSAPADDAKTHPQGAEAVNDAEATDAARSTDGGDVSEFHPWDPHKAAKDVEVGDFYFKRKNYTAAEDRYREALYYKVNDATATFRLAVCLEKLSRPADARQEYESYLKILPYGPEARAAHKAVDRLNAAAVMKPAK
jgi:tetratricopeptide (TPR) repeat protein